MPPEQLALIRETVRQAKEPRAKPRTWRGAALAEELPVARVLVDKGVLHLDRYFDYAVPAELDADAQPGVRVRVRFGAGRHRVRDGRREGGGLIDGFLVERLAESDYAGPLAALAQVVSPEVVLSEELLSLARAVADRYAGSLADVLQLAVPPRNARAEKASSAAALPAPAAPDTGTWARYERGGAFLEALASGGAPRAVWNALPGPEWSEEVARAVGATLASGRGALVVVPDGRAVGRVDAALTALLGKGRHAVLTADAGPEKRYREWLAVRRGAVRAVVGTRAAMFAPVRDLGLVALWDDGDDSHSEPHAPQPHAREVLLLRAAQDKCGFLLGSWSCTVEAAQLVESGWARPLVAGREQVRGAAPLVRTVGDGDFARDEAARAARLPSLAWQVARDGLRHGPVLVQVPRRGTYRGWPVPGAGSPLGAATVPGRWRHGTRGRRGACGAGWRRPAGTVRSAAGSGCGRRSWVRGGRPRSWGGRFRLCRCGRRDANMCWTRCRGRPRSSSAHRARSPSPRADTRLPCCSTAGPCSGAPICGPGRTRCGGGWLLRRWYEGRAYGGRGHPEGRWWWSPSPPCGRCRRWCGGIPSDTRCASSRSAPSSGFRRCPGWPRWPAGGGRRRFPRGGRTAAGRRGVGAGAAARHAGRAAPPGGSTAAGGALGTGVGPGATGKWRRAGRRAEGGPGRANGPGRAGRRGERLGADRSARHRMRRGCPVGAVGLGPGVALGRWAGGREWV